MRVQDGHDDTSTTPNPQCVVLFSDFSAIISVKCDICCANHAVPSHGSVSRVF